MRYGFQIRHLIAYEVFTGSENSAIELGFEEDRRERRVAGGPQFNEIDHEDTWRDAADRVAEAGDVYGRTAEIVGYDEADDPVIVLTGQWGYRGETRTVEGRTALRDRRAGIRQAPNLSRGSASSPGAFMRNPAGMLLFSDLGEKVTRPAVGEQDIDEWTGEPLFELDGTTPIIVVA